jgi:hypothetical protein
MIIAGTNRLPRLKRSSSLWKVDDAPISTNCFGMFSPGAAIAGVTRGSVMKMPRPLMPSNLERLQSRLRVSGECIRLYTINHAGQNYALNHIHRASRYWRKETTGAIGQEYRP